MSRFKTFRGKYFFDAIFNPYKTKFLLDAENKGAKVYAGLYWMIFQAAAALKAWIGKDYLDKVDPDGIARILKKNLAH
jgi:shikimate 5-dehydrogenase